MADYEIFRIDSFAGGLNLKQSSVVGPEAIQARHAIKAMNIDLRDMKSIQSRDGYRKKESRIYDNPIVGIFPFYYNTTRHLLVKTASSTAYIIYDGYLNIHNGTASSNYFMPAVYNNLCFLADGTNDNVKYEGSTITSIGITAPGTAPTCSAGSSGSLNGTYYYYYSYYNSTTGHESGLSPVSDSIAASNQQVTVTWTASTDSQVNVVRLYRTGGTLSTTNYVTQVAIGTTSYTDSAADTALGDAEDVSTHAVLNNVRGFTLHHHQLFAFGRTSYLGYLYDSRFYKPEAFPETYYTIIGNANDPIVAIMPFEIDLIVYTEHHTYRYRYIGSNEGDVILEEISKIGCVSDNTLCEGVTKTGRPYHIFLGQSTKGRGVYLFDGENIQCISDIIDPIFTGERDDVVKINWNYINTCCAAITNNKYYLAYPETTTTVPNKVLVFDFNLNPLAIYRADFQAGAMCYDVVEDEFLFGGTAKYLYYMTDSDTTIDDDGSTINVNYQTPYLGDRLVKRQLESLWFYANTEGQTLTVKIWVDESLKSTQTCSTTSMGRVTIKAPPDCMGCTFSIEFDIDTNKRIKISPPLVMKTVPLRVY